MIPNKKAPNISGLLSMFKINT